MTLRVGLLLAALAVLLAVLACRGDDDASPNATAPGSTNATSAAARPSATATSEGVLKTGCGGGLPLGVALGQPVSRTVESGGRQRAYVLFVPLSYLSTRPAPLVLNFHGRGSTGGAQHTYSGLAPIAEREGFVLVSPQGLNNSWLLTPGVDDIQFTRDLVAQLSGNPVAQLSGDLCIDADRVYSTGMSNGGFMSMWLACRASELVAAVAPVAGVSGPPGMCGPAVPFLEFHGTEDQLVRFEGGPLPGGFTGDPVPAALAAWAQLAGCGGPSSSRVSASVELRAFEGCTAPVAYYVVEGGGHTWPGSPVAVPGLGVTTNEISAQELIWAFFAANPKKR